VKDMLGGLTVMEFFDLNLNSRNCWKNWKQTQGVS